MASNFEGFSIVWLKSAHKNFEKLPISIQKAIIKQIDFLNTSFSSNNSMNSIYWDANSLY